MKYILSLIILVTTHLAYAEDDAYLAVVKGDLKQLQRLVKTKKVQEQIKSNTFLLNFGDDLLRLAIKNQQPKILEFLLSLNGAKQAAQKPREFGISLLMISVEKDPIFTQILLDKISDIDFVQTKTDQLNETVLHKAVKENNLQAVRLILKFDSSIDFIRAKDHLGKTALFHAFDDFNIEIMELILKHDPEIEHLHIEVDGRGSILKLAKNRRLQENFRVLFGLAPIQLKNQILELCKEIKSNESESQLSPLICEQLKASRRNLDTTKFEEYF